MKRSFILAAALTLAVGSANAGMVTADLEDVTNGGGFFGQIIVEDNMTGGVTVTADIADPINVGLTQGDILGVGFQIADEGLLGGLTFGVNVQDPAGIVTGTCQGANACDLFTGGTGSPGQGLDIVVQLGANGSAQGFIQTLMFDIGGITAAEFAEQLFAMRVQSIESPTFGSGASSKLTGTDGGDGGDTGGGGDDGGQDVPEPGTLALLGIGLLGAGLARRRRKV